VRITSNDDSQPTVVVPIHAQVDHSLDVGEGEPIEDVLFGRPECAKCHAFPAEDLTGIWLYDAVCVMCHGDINEYAASLPTTDRETLRTWVADGVSDSAMPGYAAEKGGPLDDQQIDTLVEIMVVAGGG
jgi:hypothetical protein